MSKTMSERLAEALAKMDEPEFIEKRKAYFKEEERKQKLSIDFFETLEFKKVFNKIIEMDNNSISNHDVDYSEDNALTRDEFYKIHGCVFLVKRDESKDVTDDFEEVVINYRGVLFGMLFGQGTLSYISKTSEISKFLIQDKLDKF